MPRMRMQRVTANKLDHIFVDMDGVLFDFVTAALWAHNFHGLDRDKFMAAWPAGEGWCFWERLGVTEETFWKDIANLSDFWTKDVIPYPWAQMLIHACQQYGPVHLITKPPAEDPAAWTGKYLAAQKYFPGLPIIMQQGDRSLLAGPGRLLIDDNESNCTQWMVAGGRAIVFPQPWNSAHAWAGSGLFYVATRMASFLTLESIAPATVTS